MSLSGKGEDHSEIGMLFHNELNVLLNKGKMFYHGGLKRIIKVKMGKLLLCVDQPERTSILQVGDHNGMYLTFWGHSCKVDGYCKENHLPSCKACHKQHLQSVILVSGDQDQSNQGLLLGSDSTPNNDTQSHVSPPCNGTKCASWDVLHPSFTFCAPTNFPINYDK